MIPAIYAGLKADARFIIATVSAQGALRKTNYTGRKPMQKVVMTFKFTGGGFRPVKHQFHV